VICWIEADFVGDTVLRTVYEANGLAARIRVRVGVGL